MSDPLEIVVGVMPAAKPVLDALNRLCHDVGSVPVDRFGPVEDGQSYRVICVHCVDRAAVAQLVVDLRRELHGNPAALALCDKVSVATLPPLDTCLSQNSGAGGLMSGYRPTRM